MGIIWEKRHCSVDDVLQEMPEPKPAYTTVQTFMRILEQKGFLGHRQDGKKHVFHPLIEKGEYTRWTLKNLKDSLFDGSAKSLLNTFISDNHLSDDDVRELIQMLQELEPESI